MAFTPICPKCGSAAVMAPGRLPGRPVGSTLELQCMRCHHTGARAHFTSREPSAVDWDDTSLRKLGHYMPTRTIPLSDEQS